MAVHVYPVNDERPHDLTYPGAAPCWCQPRIEWLDPETGRAWPRGPVVIHSSEDCREIVECAMNINGEVGPAFGLDKRWEVVYT